MPLGGEGEIANTLMQLSLHLTTTPSLHCRISIQLIHQESNMSAQPERDTVYSQCYKVMHKGYNCRMTVISIQLNMMVPEL